MTVEARTLTVLLRVVGIGLLALGPLHVVLWRVLDWRQDSSRLTPLNARVFFAHLVSVVFVVMALGLLLLARAELLVARGELARLLLSGVAVFFGARLIAQPFFFDPVLARGWRWRTALRIVAITAWLGCFCVLLLALAHQLGREGG
ncbi:MAG TPA: hypothetical protein VIG99_22390 [Myxococcaceae bacterium]|jgi:hypothetical protein